MPTTVFFDLDGTLTDPKPGIVGSVRHALTRLNIKEQPDDLDWCIGPPLQESFADLVPEDQIDQAISAYRERFATIGLYENRVYDGVEEMLDAVSAYGAVLYVATAKPHVFARQILDHFQLSGYFADIFGSELDGRHSDKGDLLAYAIEKTGVDPDHALMIGDRKHDIVAAHKNGMPAAGVLWGYGSRDELQQAGAQCILSQIRHLSILAKRGGIAH